MYNVGAVIYLMLAEFDKQNIDNDRYSEPVE